MFSIFKVKKVLKIVFCGLVGLKCTILVLSVFIFSRHVKHQLKNSFSKFRSCSSVSATIIRSSAYNKEFMCTLSRSSVGPHYFKCIAKSLIYKLNNVGDKYSPWRTPQTFSNHCERSGTFSSMHDMVFVRRVFIDLYILPSRLLLNNLYKRSFLLTQWNAFSISWMHSMLLCFQWYYFW